MTASVLIETGRYGKKAILTSAWSDKIRKQILAKNVVELELNTAKGWIRDDLAFLALLPHLLSVEIIDFRIESVNPIHSLQRLKSLKVSTYCNTEIHFSAFPELECCSLEWRPKATTIFDCLTLQELFINRYDGKNLDPFSKLINLKSLGILNCPAANLLGLKALKGLLALRLANLKKVTSLSGLEELQNLESLQIDTCRAINSIEEIGNLEKLRKFVLGNCGDIASFKPLATLPNLEWVLFPESTNVVDGDLSPLIINKNLSRVAFQNRRHYSHQREEMKGYC